MGKNNKNNSSKGFQRERSVKIKMSDTILSDSELSIERVGLVDAYNLEIRPRKQQRYFVELRYIYKLYS